MRIQQVSIEAFDCKASLDNSKTLRALVDAIIREVGATVCGEVVHQYVPHGVTLVTVLAESHLVLSTWPEHRYVHIDIGWSGKLLPDETIRLEVSTRLRSSRVDFHWLKREVSESEAITT